MDSRELAIRISTIFGVSRSQVSADPGNDPALDWAADVIEAFRAATLKEAADRAERWQTHLCKRDEWPCEKCRECADLRAAIMEEPK